MYTRLFKRLHNKMMVKGISYELSNNLISLFHKIADQEKSDRFLLEGLEYLEDGVVAFKSIVWKIYYGINKEWEADKKVKKFIKAWCTTGIGNEYYWCEKATRRSERCLRVGDVLCVYYEDRVDPQNEIIIEIEPPNSWGSNQAGIITATVQNWNSGKKVQGEYIASDRWELLGHVHVDVENLDYASLG